MRAIFAALGCSAFAAAVGLGLGCDPASAESRSISFDSGAAAPTAEPGSVAANPREDEEINPRLLRRFQPIEAPKPPATKVDAARVVLGDKLFHDTSLSADGSVACASCHPIDKYGADARPTSLGIAAQHGARNAPTVLNASFQFRMFWDGRSENLEDQAKHPILNPAEMGLVDAKAVVRTLSSNPEYAYMFHDAFPEQERPITFDNYAVAVAAFERTLVTRSRWDQFLEGDTKALSLDEKRGLKTFLNAGCMVCHTGKMLGGSMYERVGVVEAWPNQEDPGRFAVTKDESDRMMFKVPTLRNVAETAPYFHDGSAATLDQAVRMMGKHQLGLELEQDEVASIIAWLKSLTGPLPKRPSAAK
jgi:cytochrome c peroxidase